MSEMNFQALKAGVASGDIVPYLGAGALKGSSHSETGEPIPADSESLILAMNGGKPMAPRLMYEFARAAMDVELKRGRNAVHRFLDTTYAEQSWTQSPLHAWLESIKPAYIVDINRDTQLQQSYSTTPHTLIRGIARIGGTDYRFRIHHYDGEKYSASEIDQSAVDTSLPILFKPMGSPAPDATYIVSDADYVDYITELMGGFGMPKFLKEYRKDKRYLFLGLRMTRDTERMVLSDIIYAAGNPAGWALIPEPNDKERRFCKKMNIEIIEADIDDLLGPVNTNPELVSKETGSIQDVGC
ncbi:MAG: SIR2 family protein [gamma proteobacterium symbiont of Ctena orbiculata]|nr:MAG: SIR2 family protein [gamma proteobacterium symbiont of Ctena orbiculata]PVV18441.1 MAG: SIR2 family protein [gamma proteobacterium symbiont of Ctena orbiculata]